MSVTFTDLHNKSWPIYFNTMEEVLCGVYTCTVKGVAQEKGGFIFFSLLKTWFYGFYFEEIGSFLVTKATRDNTV